jgi:threonine/homoserine/homoserine lactone efflux protein
MDIDTWIIFSIAYLVTTISPGPNVLLVLKNTVKYGKGSALATIVGNLSCQLLIVILVALGVGSIIAKTPLFFLVLKICGGMYLIYLGICNLLSSHPSSIKPDWEVYKRGKGSFRKIYKESFLVSASNPKTIIFLSAFLPQFLNDKTSVNYQFCLMFITISLIVFAIHMTYSYFAELFKNKLASTNIRNVFSKITGSAFIAMGGSVLLSNRTS